MRRVQADKPHALKDPGLDLVHDGVGDLAMRKVPPPDEHVRRG